MHLLVAGRGASVATRPFYEDRDSPSPELVRGERDVPAGDVAEACADQLRLPELGDVQGKVDLPGEPPL